MANPEHLEILKQGVEVWNTWRRENKNVVVDLSGANLVGADLSRANLIGARFVGANLYRANFNGANLYSANFNGANVCGTNLVGANLNKANLGLALFCRADLRKAALREANLHKADLSEVNLSEADLVYADLRNTYLLNARLTGACLHATARFGWIIAKVECDYIFFDAEHKKRQPKDRIFEPGEFERLYRSIPTIEVVFEQGMNLFDPLLLSIVEQQLSEQHPKLGIELLSIDKRGLHPQAIYGVSSDDDKEQALKLVLAEYKQQIKSLQTDKSRLHEMLKMSLETNKMLAAPKPATHAITVQGSVVNSNVLQGAGNTIHQELDKAGITEQQLEEFVAEIRDEQELITATQELQAKDIDTLKFAIERLRPHLEKAFNQQFDTRGQKLLKLLSQEALKLLGGDFLGDQVDLGLA